MLFGWVVKKGGKEYGLGNLKGVVVDGVDVVVGSRLEGVDVMLFSFSLCLSP